MIKLAQKKFKDPKRQSLEDNKQNIFKAKKLWNSYLKDFRKELRETQALINGRVEGQERIRIDQPLPENTLQSLTELSDKFQKRVEEGSSIYRAQSRYSQEYNSFFSELENKRLQKTNKEQLPEKKEASFNYELEKQAGIGPVGIFWESVKSFFSGDEDARRVTLLRQLASIDSGLSKIEYSITSARKTDEIDAIRKSMYDLWRKVKSIKSVVAYGRELSERKAREEFEETLPSEKSPDDSIDKEIEKIKTDLSEGYDFFRLNRLTSFQNVEKKDIEKSRDKISSCYLSLERQPNNQSIKESIIQEYKNLIRLCLRNDYSSFTDYKRLYIRAYLNYSKIVKLAESDPHDPLLFKLKKWISSIGLNMSVFLGIRSNLIDASEVVHDCREVLNECINDLKSGSEINHDLQESSLKECADLLEQSINNLDSVATFISSNSVDDKTFDKVNRGIETGFLKSFFRRLTDKSPKGK